eukprot:SAG31_NODE_12455_length_940_cov_1.332937_1_plen_70_part_10
MVFECVTLESCVGADGVWSDGYCADKCAAATYWGCKTEQSCLEVGYSWKEAGNYCDAFCSPEAFWACTTA